MSRSYKKEPVCKDSTRKGRTWKSGKQIANRVVRHKQDLPGGGGYRKAYCSYNISDYRFRMDERELQREWESGEGWICRRFTTYPKALLWWKKGLSVEISILEEYAGIRFFGRIERGKHGYFTSGYAAVCYKRRVL